MAYRGEAFVGRHFKTLFRALSNELSHMEDLLSRVALVKLLPVVDRPGELEVLDGVDVLRDDDVLHHVGKLLHVATDTRRLGHGRCRRLTDLRAFQHLVACVASLHRSCACRL